MIATDIILILSLAVYLIVCWSINLKKRSLILIISAFIALIAGGVGVVEHRWQGIIGVISAAIFLLSLLISLYRGVNKRHSIPWCSGTIVGLLVAVSCFLIYLFPVSDLPAPSGEYVVGTQSFELTDDSRLGVLDAQATSPRRLLVRVWYPASGTHGLTARPYFTNEEVNTSAGDMFSSSYFLQFLKYSQTNSYTNAPLIDLSESRMLPVVFYSHGYMSFAGQNTILMEELASHGYIVYSVQHTYESQPTVFPNGDVEEALPIVSYDNDKPAEFSDATKKAFAGVSFDERYEGSINRRKEVTDTGSHIETVSTDVWLKDRIFVLDELQRGNVPEVVDNIVHASDFSKTAQMGMSFGGSTAGALCMKDSRCAVAINLDGKDFHGTPFSENIPVPLLMLYSDFNSPIHAHGGNENSLRRGWNDFSYERPETSGLRKDIYRMSIPGLKHMAFSDFTLFTRNPVQDLILGSDDIIDIQNDFVRGFLDKYLLGKSNGFPQKEYEKYSSIVEKNEINDIRDWWITKHPEDEVERVILETAQGVIELALYSNISPLSVDTFIKKVDAGRLNDTTSIVYKNGKILLFEHGQLNSLLSIELKSSSLFLEPKQYKSDDSSNQANGFVLRGMRILEQIQINNEREFSVRKPTESLLAIETAQRVSTK